MFFRVPLVFALFVCLFVCLEETEVSNIDMLSSRRNNRVPSYVFKGVFVATCNFHANYVRISELGQKTVGGVI